MMPIEDNHIEVEEEDDDTGFDRGDDSRNIIVIYNNED